jgi:hypothetical protein
MKTCRNCGKDKPREEFYKHTSSPDRLMYNCKECHKAHMREHWRSSPEYRKAHNECHKIRYHTDPKTRERELAASKRQRERNKAKKNATSVVQ